MVKLSTLEAIGKFQDNSARQEADELRHDGIEPLSMEALPRYSAWSRSDLAGILAMLAVIETHLRWIRYALVILAVAGIHYLIDALWHR
jgi:hypothetical protein